MKSKKILAIAALIVLLGTNTIYAYKYDSYKKDSIIEYNNIYYKIVSDNIITNNSFESGVSNWTSGSGSTLSTSSNRFSVRSGESPDGETASYLQAPTTTNTNNISSTASGDRSIRTLWGVTSGKTYYFSYFLKRRNNNNPRYQYCYIQWVANNNTATGTSGAIFNGSSQESITTDEWQNREYVSTASASNLRFAYGGCRGFCFDEFYLFEIEKASSDALDEAIELVEDYLGGRTNATLSAALTTATNVIGTKATIAEYDAAAETLWSVYSSYACEALDEAIELVEDYLEDNTNATLSAALATAKAVRETKTTITVYNAAANTLMSAYYSYFRNLGTNVYYPYFQNLATHDDPLDFTSWLINPSFEDNPPYASGWNYYESDVLSNSKIGTAEVKVVDVADSTLDYGTYYMRPYDGTYAFNTWYGYSNSGHFKIQQTINNVPNGIYTVSALAATGYYTTNVDSSGYLYNVDLFCNDSITIPSSDMGRAHAVRRVLSWITVGNNTLTVGVSATNWFKVDDFQITYYGLDSEIFDSKLDSLLAIANAFDLSLLPNGVDAILLQAIAQGESAKESQDADDILAAISQFYNVFPTVRSSIPSYGDLDNLLEYFQTIYSVMSDPTDDLAMAIDSVYDMGWAVYAGAETLQPAVEDAVEAMRLFLNSIASDILSYGTCVYPVDASLLVKNNSFETNPRTVASATNSSGIHVPDDWNLDVSFSQENAWRTMCEGLKDTYGGPGNRVCPDGSLYHYNAWGGYLNSIDLYQTISNLEEGYYSVSAYMLTRSDTYNDQHIYLKYGNTTYTSPSVSSTTFQQLSTDYVYVEDGGSIRIGAASTGDGNDDGAWFGVDYFTLSYYRLPCTFYYASDDGEGDWSDDDNWRADAVDGRVVNELPIMTSDVVVKNVTLNVDQDVRVKDLTVAPDGQLTIESGNTLTVNHLVLKSNSQGTATLLDVDENSIVVKQSATMEQYVTGTGSTDNNGVSTPTGRGWYLASPMVDAKSSSYWNMEIRDVWSFSETKGDTQTASNPYIKLSNATTPLISGQAYQVRMWKDTTVRYIGTKFFTGDLDVKITRGTIAKKRGFNLVGNPYPSHVVISDALNYETMSPTIWYRTATVPDAVTKEVTMVFDTYNCLTGLGTGNGFRGEVSDEVPPTQSLWVRLKTDGSSDYVKFRNSQRTHGSATNLLRSAKVSDKEVVKVQISRDEIYKDAAILVYMDAATDNFEDYDSEKQFNSQLQIPEIWTKSAGTEVVINAMSPIETYQEYPLGYLTYVEGYHKIKATEVAIDAQVVIKDLKTGAVFDLTNGDEFVFYSEAYVDTESRFVLLVDKTKAELDRLQASKVQVFGGHGVLDFVYNDSETAHVQIYSLVGTLMEEMTLNQSTQMSMPAGVYMVKVRVNDKTNTQKVVVK